MTTFFDESVRRALEEHTSIDAGIAFDDLGYIRRARKEHLQMKQPEGFAELVAVLEEDDELGGTAAELLEFEKPLLAQLAAA